MIRFDLKDWVVEASRTSVNQSGTRRGLWGYLLHEMPGQEDFCLAQNARAEDWTDRRFKRGFGTTARKVMMCTGARVGDNSGLHADYCRSAVAWDGPDILGNKDGQNPIMIIKCRNIFSRIPSRLRSARRLTCRKSDRPSRSPTIAPPTPRHSRRAVCGRWWHRSPRREPRHICEPIRACYGLCKAGEPRLTASYITHRTSCRVLVVKRMQLRRRQPSQRRLLLMRLRRRQPSQRHRLPLRSQSRCRLPRQTRWRAVRKRSQDMASRAPLQPNRVRFRPRGKRRRVIRRPIRGERCSRGTRD